MKLKLILILVAFLVTIGICNAQGVYTAASNSLADVNDCVNGTGLNTCQKTGAGSPATHTVVNGDEVIIPAGVVTWTGQLSFTACIYLHGNATLNNTPGVKGVGTLNTTIYDGFNGGTAPLINFPGVAYSGCDGTAANKVLRISGIEIQPCLGNNNPVGSGCSVASTNIGPPMNGWGIATSSGIPHIRIDNIGFDDFTTGHAAGPPTGNGDNSNAKIRISDFVGSVDHNTATIASGAPGQEFINSQQQNYFGVPALPTTGYGDNSWHLPWPLASSASNLDQITLEDNDLHGSSTESEFPPIGLGGAGGGGRFEARFNAFHDFIGTPDISCHGTDTEGRPRVGCKYVAYFNTHVCNGSSQCGMDLGPLDQRDGAVMAYGETISATGGPTNFRLVLDIEHQRTARDTAYGRVGASVFDKLDGRVDTGPFTIGASGVTGNTICVSTSPWTSGAMTLNTTTPGANIWLAYDKTTGGQAFVLSNTSNCITVGGFTSIGLNGNAWTNSGQLYLVETTLYGAGLATAGGSTTLSSSQTYLANQFQQSGNPYSLSDATVGFSSTIASNTTNTFSYDSGPSTNGGTTQTWNSTDVYVITRAGQSFDDPGRCQEQLISGQVPVPFSPTAILCPSYVANILAPGLTSSHVVQLEMNQTLRYLQNRDFYNETLNQAANSGCPGSCTPFSGTSGVGHGVFAQRPSTCTTGVGYFATDLGTWNTSGNGFGQLQFFKCTSANTWTLTWEPAPYPNPLIALTSGGGGGGGGSTSSVAIPTNVKATANTVFK